MKIKKRSGKKFGKFGKKIRNNYRGNKRLGGSSRSKS